jgi:hypothetical protein
MLPKRRTVRHHPDGMIREPQGVVFDGVNVTVFV